jgi:metal-responsive CopG/Arc/MetJ family transcriptional regulator
MSIRIPAPTRKKLDRVSAKTGRSRSNIVLLALERHLDELERQEATKPGAKRFSTLLSLAGAGAARNGPRDAEEILATSRWLRDND